METKRDFCATEKDTTKPKVKLGGWLSFQRLVWTKNSWINNIIFNLIIITWKFEKIYRCSTAMQLTASFGISIIKSGGRRGDISPEGDPGTRKNQSCENEQLRWWCNIAPSKNKLEIWLVYEGEWVPSHHPMRRKECFADMWSIHAK